MTQPSFFDQPRRRQEKATLPPHQGLTPQSRASSYSGARAAMDVAESQMANVYRCFQSYSPMGTSDQQVAMMLKIPLASVNARRRELMRHDLVEAGDTPETYLLNRDGKIREIQRTRWRARDTR